MSTYKRRQIISAILREQGEVTIEELSARLEVSENTIRNDLDAMEAENSLRRIRGGAVALERDNRSTSPALAERSQINRQEKHLIARWAAHLVEDGDTIMLDASSTIYHMATFLKQRRSLTVLTNGIDVARLLAENATNKVILVSNVVRPDGFSTVGELHPSVRKRFFAPKCFISCVGFSFEQGLTVSEVDEAAVKTQMLELAQQVIVLADHSKFGKFGAFSFASLDQISFLITDSGADPLFLERLQEEGHFPIAVISSEGERRLEPFQPRQQRVFRIGFGNLTEQMPFARQVRASLEEAAKHLHNLELLILDNNLERQRALDNADHFVRANVDLIIEYQLDAEAGNVIMDKFNQAKIPVIAVDIPLPGATFFGADNYRAGYTAGENLGHWINKHWQGHFDFLLKVGIERVGALVGARLQGLREGLEAIVGRIPDDRVVTVSKPVLLEEVRQTVSQLVDQFPPDTRIAIIAINDDGAVGALEAFEAAGRLHQVVAVGQNADQTGQAALRRPDFPFIGSTRYAPEEYGEKLLTIALRILNGEAVPPAVYQQHVFINRENLDEYYP